MQSIGQLGVGQQKFSAQSQDDLSWLGRFRRDDAGRPGPEAGASPAGGPAPATVASVSFDVAGGPLARGLSTVQICTDAQPGRFVVVQQGQNVRFGVDWNGETGEKCDGPGKPASPLRRVGADRKAIRELSRRSRRLLMRRGNAIPWHALNSDYHLAFVTLTYPAEYCTARESKRDFRAWVRQLSREYGDGAVGLWKLEPQERGAPHYHVLVGLSRLGDEDYTPGAMYLAGRRTHPTLLAFRDWVAQSWFEVVGSGDERHLWAGTSVESVRDPSRVTAYLCKYISKAIPEGLPGWENPGRFWGYIGLPVLRQYLAGTIRVVSRATWLFLRRVFRRVAIARAKARCLRERSKGRRYDWRRASACWRRASSGGKSWSTFEPRGSPGLGVADRVLMASGVEAVVRVQGVFL